MKYKFCSIRINVTKYYVTFATKGCRTRGYATGQQPSSKYFEFLVCFREARDDFNNIKDRAFNLQNQFYRDCYGTGIYVMQINRVYIIHDFRNPCWCHFSFTTESFTPLAVTFFCSCFPA